MESFFLAETLKYLYLIFDKDNFLFNDLSPKLVKNLNGKIFVVVVVRVIKILKIFQVNV